MYVAQNQAYNSMLRKNNYFGPSPCPPSPARLLAFSMTKYNVTQQQHNKKHKCNTKFTNSSIAMPKTMFMAISTRKF
jgi:hypothetical protein